MFSRGRGPVFSVTLLVTPLQAATLADNAHWWVSLDSVSYSEPQSVYDALTRWGETFDRGTQQWTYNRFELGWHNGDWGVALVQRADYRVELSDDGVEFWGNIERREPLVTGRQYHVTAVASGYTGTGIKFIKLIETGSLGHGSVGVSGWRIDRVLDGTLNGWALATSGTEYDYQAEVDYFYTEDPLFGRPDLERATGWGYGLDIEWGWQERGWRIHADVRDLMGRIYWRSVPYTNATSTSARKEYDANGYLLLNPAISGFEGYKDVTQSLDTQARLKVQRRLPDTRFWVSTDAAWLGGQLWGAVGAAFQATPSIRWEAHVWPELTRLDLGYHHQDWSLELGLDRLDVRSARAVTLNVAWRVGQAAD